MVVVVPRLYGQMTRTIGESLWHDRTKVHLLLLSPTFNAIRIVVSLRGRGISVEGKFSSPWVGVANMDDKALPLRANFSMMKTIVERLPSTKVPCPCNNI